MLRLSFFIAIAKVVGTIADERAGQTTAQPCLPTHAAGNRGSGARLLTSLPAQALAWHSIPVAVEPDVAALLQVKARLGA